MVASNFSASLALTLEFEGGYSDHPADPGGATKYGITRAVLADWRGRAVSKADVQAMTRSEAEAIYRRNYWDGVGGDELPGGVDAVVFDYAVNSGPDRASRALQSAVGVVADGIVGMDTVNAACADDPARLVRAICQQRRGFLGRLKIFPVFGRGWLRRVERLEQFALALAKATPVTTDRAVFPSTTPKETSDMSLSKTIFESRTIWANLIGLAALAASAFGFDTAVVDQGAMVDAVLNVIAGAGFVASTVFRIKATRQIQ